LNDAEVCVAVVFDVCHYFVSPWLVGIAVKPSSY